MNKEFQARTTDDSSTNADGNSVSPTCPKPNVMRRFGLFVVNNITMRNFGFIVFYFVCIGSLFGTLNWNFWIWFFVAMSWFTLIDILSELKKGKNIKITIDNLTVRPKDAHLHIYKSEADDDGSKNGA